MRLSSKSGRSRFVASIISLALICIFSGCGGSQPAPRALFINLTPHGAAAWAKSAEDSVSYHVTIEYSDGRSVPMTSGLTWSVDQPWVYFNSDTATATCVYSAPQMSILGPQPAAITVSATIEARTFTDTAVLDCL